MSKYLALTGVMLKNLNLFGMRSAKQGKSRIKGIMLSILILAAFLPMMFGIGTFTLVGYDVLSEIRQEGIILGFGFSVSCLTIFFFGIFYVMSIFYFSKDIERLLPLPLTPWEILASKFTVTVIYEYIMEFVFLAPILIGFGIANKAGLLYYLYSIIIFITLPVLPVVYASILSTLIMGFTNIAKNKDRFRIFGGITAMLLAVGLNAFITKTSSSAMNAKELQQLLVQGNNSYLHIMSGIFFSNRFALTALLNIETFKGFLNLTVFVLLSLLSIMLFLSLGEGVYLKGAVGVSEVYGKRRKYSQGELKKYSRQKSALGAHTQKELKLLFRTPVYFINCVILNFIFPIILVLPFIAQPDSMGELKILSTYISNETGGAVVLAAAFGISSFITSVSGITASAISREGANIYVCKYLPVSYKIQIMAKVLSGIAMGAVGTLSMLIMFLVFVRIPVYIILFIVVVCILGIIFSSFTGILIDLNFPKLLWDNEQKAVKQNFNVILNILASLVIAGIPVFVTIALKFTPWMTFLTIVGVFSILDALLYKILTTLGAGLFKNIEG